MPSSAGKQRSDGRQGLWTYTAWVVDRAGNVSAVSNALAIRFETMATDAPVFDLPLVFDSTSSTEIYTLSLHDALPISNTAGEPAFGYLHELSPNGRSSTGGAYDANAPGCGFVGSYAPYADSAGGLGSDGRKGVWTYTAWAFHWCGNVGVASNACAICFA